MRRSLIVVLYFLIICWRSADAQIVIGNNHFLQAEDLAVHPSGDLYVLTPYGVSVTNSNGEFLRKFGKKGSGPGEFMAPFGIAVTLDKVFVTDVTLNNLQIFTLQGELVYSIGNAGGLAGNGNYEFNRPEGVAVDATGDIYVADGNNSRVQIFSSNYTYEASVYGNGTDSFFSYPRRVTFDDDGKIYVLDQYGRRVYVFHSDRTFDFWFGEFGTDPDQFAQPSGICISGDNIYVSDESRVKFFQKNNGTFVGAFSDFGTDPGFMQQVSSIRASSDVLYVADRGSSMINFFSSTDHSFSKRVGSNGSANGQLWSPQGVGVNSAGKIFIANGPDVEIFSSSGEFLNSFGGSGLGPGQFGEPSALAIDASDNVYVADANLGRIQKFTSDGTFISAFGPIGEFSNPLGVAVASNGNLYVVDTGNSRIRILDPLGNAVATFGANGTSTGQFDWPGAIALDENNNVYVVDTYNYRVQVFNSNGEYVRHFGTQGTGNGQLNEPFGIALDELGNIYVSDLTRIQKFSNGGAYLETFIPKGSETGECLNPRYLSVKNLRLFFSDITRVQGVGRQSQSITFDAIAPKTFGDPEFTLNATASSGLNVIFESSDESVATIIGNQVTIVGGGTATITARQPGNANDYFAATPIDRILTVNKATQTITFGVLEEKIFGAVPFELTATVSSGLPITYSSSEESVAIIDADGTVTIVGGGTTRITASQAGNTSYHAAIDVYQDLIVNPAEQTITFEALPVKAVNNPPFELTAVLSSGLEPIFTSSDPAVATISGNIVTITGAGQATITCSSPASTDYELVSTTQELIVRASQTISFDDLPPATYGEPGLVLLATSSSGLPVEYSSSNPAIASVVGNTVSIHAAGTVTITASQPGDVTFGPANPVSRSLTINKASQTITFNSLPENIYFTKQFDLTATISSGFSPIFTSTSPSIASLVGHHVTIQGVGTASIIASHPGDDNFLPASVEQTFTAGRAPQTITFPSIPVKHYGDASFDLNAFAMTGLEVSYESGDESVATISGKTVSLHGPGTVKITASQGGNDFYLPADPVEQELTVVDLVNISGNLAFGETTIGQTVSQTVIIRNDGGTNYHVTSVTTPAGFSVPVTDFIVLPGFTQNLSIRFSPITAASYAGQIALISDNAIRHISVSGAGVSVPETVTITGDLTFGETIVGESVSKTLTIKNDGGTNYHVTSITTPDGFSVPVTDFIVLPGFTQNLSVRFTPTAATSYDGLIALISDNSIRTVPASGLGVMVTGSESPFETQGLDVWPNPSNGLCTLDISDPDSESARWTLVDSKGVVLKGSTPRRLESGKFEIDLRDKPAGLYVLNVTIGTNTYFKRIIKTH
jgi:sugar lactone lactonase YvrE